MPIEVPTSESTTPAGVTPRQAPERRVPLRTGIVLFLAFFVWAVGLTALSIKALPGISPVDGIVYSDALDRALSGQVTVRGDRMGDATSQYIGCRGVEGYGTVDIPCEPPYPDNFKGYTSAYVHPPTYFFATAAGVKALQVVFPDTYVFDLARFVSALWFSLGALVMVIVAVRWGARTWTAAAVLAALLPTPLFMTMYTFITPDSMALLVCAGVALGATLWIQGKVPTWSLLLFGALAGLVKQTYLLAPLTGAALIVLLWFLQRQGSARRSLVAAGTLLAGAGVSLLTWEITKRVIATTELPPSGPDPFAQPRSFDGFFGLFFHGAAELPIEAAGPLIKVPLTSLALGSAFLLVLAGATFGALFYLDRRSDVFAIAAAATIVIVTGGALLSVLYMVSSGIFLPPTVRYVYGAFPFYVLPLLLVRQHRIMLYAAGAGAVVAATSWLLLAVAG